MYVKEHNFSNLGIVVDWQNIADVVMFCVPSDVKYATGHGVVAIDEQVCISV